MKMFRFFRPRPLVRRLLAAVQCAALAVSLAACAQKAPQYEPQPGVTYTQLLSDMNLQFNTPLSQDMKSVRWWAAVQGRIVAYGLDYDLDDPQNTEKRREHLLADVDTNGNGYSCLELTLPEVTDATPQLKKALSAAPQDADLVQGYDSPVHVLTGIVENAQGELYLLLEDSLLHYSQDERGEVIIEVTERALTLCTLGEDGMVQPAATLPLPEAVQGALEIGDNLLFDEAGGLWVSAADFVSGQGWLLRYTVDGTLQKTLPLPKGVTFSRNGVCLLPKDRLAVIGYTADQSGFVQMDNAQVYVAESITGDAPTWQAPLLPSEIESAPGCSLLAFIPILNRTEKTVTMYTSDGIYDWKPEINVAHPRFLWKDLRVDTTTLLACFDTGADQAIAICRQDDQPATSYQLRVLTPVDPASLGGRRILTMGGFGATLDIMRPFINQLNAVLPTTYVQTTDYSFTAANEQGFSNGREMLKRDIIKDCMPDILFANLLDESTFSKGTMIDLYPYLDADPELSREDFLPNILKATERNGELTSIMVDFGFQTLIGPSSLVGDTPGWTWAEYDALCAAHPDAVPVFNMSRLQFLVYMVLQGGNKYLDGAARQAYFDTPAFAQLLQASAVYPAQPDYSQLDPKPSMEKQQALTEFQAYSFWRRVWNQHYVYGDDFTFIGFPNDEGNNGAFITPGIQLGITSDCEDPDAAWQVLRTFLLPEFQNYVAKDNELLNFPARLDALEYGAQLFMQPGTQRVRSGYAPLNRGAKPDEEDDVMPKEYFMQAVSQQDVDKIMEILQGLETLGTGDSTVQAILAEEADAFYNGQRSAEDAAKIIQDRVQTYLDEQS